MQLLVVYVNYFLMLLLLRHLCQKEEYSLLTNKFFCFFISIRLHKYTITLSASEIHVCYFYHNTGLLHLLNYHILLLNVVISSSKSACVSLNTDSYFCIIILYNHITYIFSQNIQMQS